eukprot:COSAG02_NODE_2993_length_7592_cov_3.886427_5_plen_85_part_00
MRFPNFGKTGRAGERLGRAARPRFCDKCRRTPHSGLLHVCLPLTHILMSQGNGVSSLQRTESNPMLGSMFTTHWNQTAPMRAAL